MRVRMGFIQLAALLLSISAAVHAEKKVYKCAHANGTVVFSPDPCGEGAQELKVDVGIAPPGADMPGTAPSPAARALDIDSGDAEDGKCRADAQRLQVYPAEGNLQSLMQRQTELLRAYGATTSGGDAIKVQIGNLDAQIAIEQARLSNEHDRVDRTYRSAIAKCDAAKAERDRKAEQQRKAEEERREKQQRENAAAQPSGG